MKDDEDVEEYLKVYLLSVTCFLFSNILFSRKLSLVVPRPRSHLVVKPQGFQIISHGEVAESRSLFRHCLTVSVSDDRRR